MSCRISKVSKMSCMNITDLPQECLSHILSLTSVTDIIRSSVVSKHFLTASESEAIWNKFLPSNFDELVSQSSKPRLLQHSKKKLFLSLCFNPVLFKGETQSFGLNKWNGKKCFMFGAKALKIVWGDTPYYWRWTYRPESRFPKTAELMDVCWLLIEANISPSTLSPKTTYGAYFVFKMDVNQNGFKSTPVKVSVFEVHKEDDEASGHPPSHVVPFKLFYLKVPSFMRRLRRQPREDMPVVRVDGWMEIEMDRYCVSDGVDESVMLRMTLFEVEEGHWKRRLVVQGIELRPLD